MKQRNNELITIKRSELYSKLTIELKNVIDFIFTQNSVYEISGDEFPNNGQNIIIRVLEYYNTKFNNVVNNKILGQVKLNKRSIKDSIYHGKSNNKINAFAAVPYVIEKGIVANTQFKYQCKNENRYFVVAPITIKGEKYFCEVVIREPIEITKDGEKLSQKSFYIHEVELTNKLADSFTRTPQQGLPTSSKSIIADLINKLNNN